MPRSVAVALVVLMLLPLWTWLLARVAHGGRGLFKRRKS